MDFAKAPEKPISVDEESIASSNSIRGDIYNNAPPGKATNWQTYVNVVSVLAGAGTLGLPKALSDAGWFGLFILALACLMAIYSNKKLIECLYYDGKNRLDDYPQIGRAAFGIAGQIFVAAFYNSIALGGPILYLILIGTNIQSLVGPLGSTITIQQWIMVAAAIMTVPLILTKTMKEVSYLSIFGALSTAVVVIIVAIASIIDQKNITEPVHHDGVIARNIPISLATFAFSYGGNICFPAIEASMKSKQSWGKVVTYAILTVTALYAICATSGYAVYGEAVLSPVYMSLPAGAVRTVSTIIITIHVLMAIPLFLVSFNLQIERAIRLDSRGLAKTSEFAIRAVIRTLSMVFVATLALFFPYFSQVMSLLGALSDGMLTFVFPLVFSLKLFGWRSVSKPELIMMLAIVILGTVSSVIGTIDAIHGLIDAFNNDKN